MKIFIVGSINMDLVINAPFMPENGMTINGSNFLTNPGGKGANQAVAVSKLGGNSYMVGAVGEAFGSELKNTLDSYGVNTEFVKEYSNTSSGIAVIVVVDGDNRIILDAGSNALVDRELIDTALSYASEGDYLICQLEIPQESVRYALKKAKEIKMVTVLNPAPAANLIDGILENVDIFNTNQFETEFYTGIYPKDEKTQMEAAHKLNDMGVSTVLITLGAHGSCAIQNGQYFRADGYKVNVVDTTAAGDTYIGAFVAKLSEGSSLTEAMNYASKASALTVTKQGAQQAIPYKTEVDYY
mgnify:CR=1 FL=1